MPPETTEHLKHEAVVGGVSNAIFNGLIAWLLLRGGPAQAWSGSHSFAVDIVATAFILPAIVALIVIPLQRGKLRKGKLAALQLGETSALARFANHLPNSTFLSAIVFGLLGAGVIAPLTLLLFFVLGVQQVSPENYALFKGLWAGLMAAVLVIPMVAYAHRAGATETASQTTH